MITVLTPTFNRAHTLSRVFDSLRAQSVKSFEWLVIDDGSTDDTSQLIERLSQSHAVNTRYFFQANAGKHVAINSGVQQALGNWILILDSDDALTEDAIELVYQAISKSPPTATGLCFRRAYFDQSLIGKDRSTEDPLLMHPTDAARYFQGDLAYIFKTDELRENVFPVFEGEKFVPELYIWNKIGDRGGVWYVPNKFIYLSDYLPDGYTVNFRKFLRRNPKGFGLFYRDQIFRERSWVNKLKSMIRAAQCFTYSLLKGTMR